MSTSARAATDAEHDAIIAAVYKIPNRTVVHTDSLERIERMTHFGCWIAFHVSVGDFEQAKLCARELLKAHGDWPSITFEGLKYQVRDGEMLPAQDPSS